MKLDFMEIGLSDFCQNRCIMCHQSKSYFQKHNNNFIDTGLIKKLVKNLKNQNFSINTLYLFWIGEPLLHPDFPELLEILSQERIFKGLVINTNGLELNKENTDAILHFSGFYDFSHLIISMDTLNSETYSRIRIGGQHQTLMKNFSNLLNKKQDHFPLIIPQFIIMDENRDEIEEFISGVKIMGEKYSIDFNISCSRHDIHSDTIYLRPLLFDEEWINNSEQKAAWKKNFNVWKEMVYKYSSHLDPEEIIRLESADPRNIPEGVCSSIFKGAIITSSGKIVPCCGDYFEELVMGDLNSDNFSEIWKSRRYQNLRNSHLKNSLPEKCRKCYLPSESRISIEEAEFLNKS